MVGGVVKATKGIGGFCSVVPPEAHGDDTQTGPGALGRRRYITGLHSVVPNHWDRIGYRVLPNRQSFTSGHSLGHSHSLVFLLGAPVCKATKSSIFPLVILMLLGSFSLGGDVEDGRPVPTSLSESEMCMRSTPASRNHSGPPHHHTACHSAPLWAEWLILAL
jgi:hypothetical protein